MGNTTIVKKTPPAVQESKEIEVEVQPSNRPEDHI
jgi:hypothetical protein